jgi:hypothetical protein
MPAPWEQKGDIFVKFKNIFLQARIIIGLSFALMFSALPVMAAEPSQQPVLSFSNGSVVGSSTVLKNEEGATMIYHSSGLPMNTPMTILWVIFNNPENCAGPSAGHPFQCGASDLFNSAVNGSVVVGPTKPTSGRGGFNVGDHLNVDDATNALIGSGLTNSANADIHLVVSSTPDLDLSHFLQFSVHEF